MITIENKIKADPETTVYVIRYEGKQLVIIDNNTKYRIIDENGDELKLHEQGKILKLLERHINKKIFKKYTDGKVDTYC